MKVKTLFKQSAIIAFLTTLSMSVNAAQINVGDFVAPTIFNYNSLGLPFDNVTPIVLGGQTHETDDSVLRYTAFSSQYVVSGEAIGNNTDVGYIDIVVSTPVLRAGGWVGASDGYVEFFGANDNLLGTVQVTPSQAGTPVFAGWDASPDYVHRVRITDTQANGTIVIFDDLYTEGETTVEYTPVPSLNNFGKLALLLFLALMGTIFLRTRRV